MASYRAISETDLLEVLSALKNLADRLEVLVEKGGTIQFSSSKSEKSKATKKRQSLPPDRSSKVQEIVKRVKGGGPRHRPKQFDREGPSISDFIFYLMDKAQFRTSEAAERIKLYVILDETPRKAAGQVRSSLARDARFTRTSGGDWIKMASGAH